jgi:hypothetical protein
MHKSILQKCLDTLQRIFIKLELKKLIMISEAYYLILSP